MPAYTCMMHMNNIYIYTKVYRHYLFRDGRRVSLLQHAVQCKAKQHWNIIIKAITIALDVRDDG